MPYGQEDFKGLYDGSLKLQITLLQPEMDCKQHNTIEFSCSLNKITLNKPFEKLPENFCI